MTEIHIIRPPPPPRPVGYYWIDNVTKFSIYQAPSWFNKLCMRYFLGWTWEDA